MLGGPTSQHRLKCRRGKQRSERWGCFQVKNEETQAKSMRGHPACEQQSWGLAQEAGKLPQPLPKYSPKKPGPLDILQNIILVHSTGDNVLLGPSMLEVLVIHVPFRWKEKNATKIQWLPACW